MNKLDPVEVAQDDILTKALRDIKSLVMSKVQAKRRLIGVMAPDSWEVEKFLITLVPDQEVHFAARAIHFT
jgi:hypothetical protein